VTTEQDCFETVGCDLCDEAEVGCLLSGPLAGKLMFVLGEVVAVVGRVASAVRANSVVTRIMIGPDRPRAPVYG